MTGSATEQAWAGARAAMLMGTSQGARAPALPEALESIPAEGAEGLLASAAALLAYGMAGSAACPDFEPFPAMDDPRPECGPRAAEALEAILAGPAPTPELLDGWCRTASATGTRVPAGLLPLLAARFRGKAASPAVAAVLGRDASWLARVREESVAPGETAAGTGIAERCARLAGWRRTHPEEARETLATVWKDDHAEDRARLLAQLRHGLSADDEEFLEAALDDRASGVREEARALLRLLPGSAYAARAAARAPGVVAFVSGSLMGMSRSRLRVVPPAADAGTARDIEWKGPGKGARTDALAREAVVRAVAAAPLSAWTSHPASDWIAAAARTEDLGEAVIEGWTRAAADGRDPDWIRALSSRFLTAGPALSIGALVHAFDRETGEHVLASAMRGASTALVFSWLQGAGWDWSDAFSHRAVAFVEKNAQSLHYPAPEVLASGIGMRASPACEPALREAIARLGADPAGRDRWWAAQAVRCLEAVADTLRRRSDMAAEAFAPSAATAP